MCIELISFNDNLVQGHSLKAVVLFLASGGRLSNDPKAVIRTVIEKCLNIEKEEIKVNSEQLLYWYMDNNYEEVLFS